MDNTTYIYIISPSEDGPVKIGYSNNPEKRLKQLQTAQSSKLILWNKFPVESCSAKAAEKTIHTQIGYKRKMGEWFNINVVDAEYEIRFGLMSF